MCNIDEMIATGLFQEPPFPMKSAGNPHRCMGMSEFNHYNYADKHLGYSWGERHLFPLTISGAI